MLQDEILRNRRPDSAGKNPRHTAFIFIPYVHCFLVSVKITETFPTKEPNNEITVFVSVCKTNELKHSNPYVATVRR